MTFEWQFRYVGGRGVTEQWSNGVGDADERVDVPEKHPLAASEPIP
jgi:hypothetical protein